MRISIRKMFRTFIRFAAFLVCATALSGCAAFEIDNAADRFDKARGQVKLGDSKQNVLQILNPTQIGLSGRYKKHPEQYVKENKLVEIFYFRSGRTADGLTTDDEFTPYVFNNGKLVGIGWAILGGAKSHGQVIQPAPVINQNIIVR